MTKDKLINQIKKASSVEIVPSYTNKKKTKHYTIIFKGIPYFTKQYSRVTCELIFHDCTFKPESKPEERFISNFQLYVDKQPFIFDYHETTNTTENFIISPTED